MMTLEDRIRRYAEKGELTHLSLAYHDGEFHALLALASPPNGYTKAEDKDPIKALEKLFALAPVKVLPRKVPQSSIKPMDPDAFLANNPDVTAAVTPDDIVRKAAGEPVSALAAMTSGQTTTFQEPVNEEKTGLPGEWTAP